MTKFKILFSSFLLICLAFGVWLIIQAQAESIQGVVTEVQSDSPKYVGSVSCRECHAGFYKLWSSSHHGLAMQPYADAYIMLGQIYEQQGKVKDAVKVYRKAASNEKLPEYQRRSFTLKIRKMQGR